MKTIEHFGIKKILIIKFLKIGDVLLTTPLIKGMKDAFPDSNLSLALYSNTASIIKGNPYINEIFEIDPVWKNLSWYERLRKEFKIIREIRKRRFDLVINLTPGERGGVISFLSGARYRIGQNIWRKRLPQNWSRILYTHLYNIPNPHIHTVERHLEALRFLGFNPSSNRPEIFFSQDDLKRVKKLIYDRGRRSNRKLVQVHPVCQLPSKQWTVERNALIINHLINNKDVDVVITSGPDDKEIEKVNLILKHVEGRYINLAGMITLKELAALSSFADLFFGVSTSAMHIAAAAGAPVIAVFGPCPIDLWYPWGGGHTVIVKHMPCLCCGQNGCNGTGISRCLEELEPDSVLKKIDEVIDRGRPYGTNIWIVP